MKRYFYTLLFLVIFIVGCTNENATDNNVNENVNEHQNEALEQDTQNTNTYIDKDVVQEPHEINIGESAFIIYPETDFTEEIRVEFIVHGIDYISEIDIEGPSTNERFDFLVLDFEVKNIGEANLFPGHHYPKLIIHNSAGHQSESNLMRGHQSFDKIKSHTFEYADLIPGGHSRGLAIVSLEKGEEIDSLYFDTNTYFNEKDLPPFVLNIYDVSKLATETATQTHEQLELRREEFIKDFFSDYDSKVVPISSTLGNMIINNLSLVQLTTEPEEFKGDAFSFNQSVDYFAEFIRDENDRIVGVRFTEQ